MSEQDRTELKLETKAQADSGQIAGNVAMTPRIEESYWAYRVRVSDTQAVVGFPKFFTVGIGFAVEEDWNTNLPYTCEAREIFDHISHNKGDDAIADADCIAAIEMIQAAVRQAVAQ